MSSMIREKRELGRIYRKLPTLSVPVQALLLSSPRLKCYSSPPLAHSHALHLCPTLAAAAGTQQRQTGGHPSTCRESPFSASLLTSAGGRRGCCPPPRPPRVAPSLTGALRLHRRAYLRLLFPLKKATTKAYGPAHLSLGVRLTLSSKREAVMPNGPLAPGSIARSWRWIRGVGVEDFSATEGSRTHPMLVLFVCMPLS